jgi:hypothetical protein
MPHFRDRGGEWENARNVLRYLQDKHRHLDVELLDFPPNHLVVVETSPYYERCIDYVSSAADRSVVDEIAADIGPVDGGELWIGCGVSRLRESRTGAIFFDHAMPHSEQNRHLLA